MEPANPKYQHDVQFYLPKVSIILPTLGREESLKRALASIEKLNYPKSLIQTIVLDGGGSVPRKVQDGLMQAEGDYVAYAANDMEYSPNAMINAILASIQNDKALVSFNEGPVLPDEGNINAHFVIRKDFLPKIGGQIFDLRYHHVGVDNLLWAKAKRLGQAMRCEEARINHYHFSTGKSEFDEVYARGWQQDKVDHDHALLKEDLALLNV